MPPLNSVDSDICRINVDSMDQKEVHGLIYEIMNDQQHNGYQEHLRSDFFSEIPGLARFRVNAFVQNRGTAAVFLTIP